MRRPPPLTRVASYPVVGGLGVVALLATLAWMMERVDIDPVVLDVRTFWAEPWRLVTSVLPHIG
ncbi:MAG: hypothetical protein JKY37_18500, partial [Nannocystaceae bacterium]|nr:hypothetical protein [Nannocystaceae bacterium]